nr:Tx-37 [Heteropoda pingtungensis]
MKLGLTVAFSALMIALVLSAETSETENDALEKTEKSREQCADVWKRCGNNGMECCCNRSCICNLTRTNCKCHRFYREYLGFSPCD